MGERKPRVGVAIPVRNGEATLPAALDSLLGQTFTDFEIVLSDNASQDRTREICLEYAARDPRIRYVRNETNLGQIANFNRVFELSRGEFLRWAGCNDWWSSDYLERCVAALDAHPAAVLVTCYQKHFDGDARCYYEEYTGPRAESLNVSRRFRRTLWFFRHSRYYIDPIYSLMRRSTLERTALFPSMIGTDLVLTAELSLIGPFVHVPQCLAFRRMTPPALREALAKRFDPKMGPPRWDHTRICSAIARRIESHPMSRMERAACFLWLAEHYVLKTSHLNYRRARRMLGALIRYPALKAYVRRRLSPEAT